VFPVNTLDPPHDLEFVRRCIYGVIRRRHQVGLPNLRQGRRAIVIDVQVKMTDGLNVPLSSRACLGFQSVHSDVDVACLFFILVLEPFLSGSSRDPFSSRDTLDRFARTAVADQDGNPIRRMKVCTDVFAC
jgi:hypothetical protein